MILFYILDFCENTVQNVSWILVYTEETVTPLSLFKECGVGKNAGWVGTRVGTEGTHLSFSYSFRRILRNWYFFAFCWSDLLTAQYKIHILKIASFFFQQFTNLTTNLFFLIYVFLIYFFLYFFRYIICMSTEKKITTCM